MRIVERLSHTGTLWITFITTILLTFMFQIAINLWGLTLIDGISDPEQTRLAIASMTSEQHIIHAWITATLDVAYPLVYGAFFIGSAFKFYGRWGWLVALPAYTVIPVDLIEGIVQVLALINIADWIGAKALLTPLKTGLFLFSLAATVIGWGIWLVKRFTSRS